MWTNVFKIGGLHQLSWFQFLPNESDLNPLPDKSVKLEQKDTATLLVLSSHLQLQKEGFLSTWSSSFVGPWDPSQGLHNPDEKIKLWLFIPGCHSAVVEAAQAAVSKLRVLASGHWLAPGDSEEIAAALSQALRNHIERALTGFCYLRFGDVFSRYHPFSQSEELFRRGQHVVEFIFAATEEAIFVHAVVSAKHIRALSSGDVDRTLNHTSSYSDDRLPVIVSPHGMRGRLTGSCPSDLVNQLYFRSGKFRTSNGIGGSACQMGGQNFYMEVTLGFPSAGNDKALSLNSSLSKKNSKNYTTEYPSLARGGHKGLPDLSSVCEKFFIYPAEAMLVPILRTSFARSSLKRFWLQNWIGPSLSGSSFFMQCAGGIDAVDGSWIEPNGFRSQHDYHSSSSSNSSSMSGISGTSSDSDYKMTTGAGDLEADADSLTCRQSDLSSNDQFQNDGPKSGFKRHRMGMTESFGQVGAITNSATLGAYRPDYGPGVLDNPAITGVANEVESQWDWDDDDRGEVMDIQTLLSEFGDFGDFFENDALPFGEPPGTAESQALMFSIPDCGDVGSNSPCTGIMDVSDQTLLPPPFPSFESLIPFSSAVAEDSPIKNLEVLKNAVSSESSMIEFVHLMKAEALMTFAPEYGAVETPTSEFSSSIFRSPYVPNSRKAEKSANSSPKSYIYSATPPSSPCLDGGDKKPAMAVSLKACPGSHDTNSNKYYTRVESGNEQHDIITSKSIFNSITAVKSVQRKMNEGAFGSEKHSFSSMKTVLATEVECMMFQASMCRIRHTVPKQLHGDPNTITDSISSKYEVKMKESIPDRIAGDIDGGMLGGPVNTPVGIWRSVGVTKGAKPSTSPSVEISPAVPRSSFNEEGVLSYGQRQLLHEFLDGLALLVQQATSFVDLAMDGECGDGPYGWLALQEQWRRGFSCGPSMVHAGCGGSLASCHSLDIAGVELVDPLSADVHVSSLISLLQSDIKAALKSAFGTVDGPLPVTEWCKGCSQSGELGNMGDGVSSESTAGECRDSSITVTLSSGEPISPSQSFALGSTSLKDGARVSETSQRRSNQEICSSESEQQLGSQIRPTLFVLPLPAILVGYQDDWLKTSASSLQLWEKAPFEPYALQKTMTYYVVCPDIDPLTSAASEFFQQLGTVYETCKLGTHSPHSVGNQVEMDSRKCSSSGFLLLDCPQSMKIESSAASLVGSISDYLLSLSNGWDLTSFLKSLSKVLKALKLGSCVNSNPKEGASGPCTVIYVVCPFPEPIAVLQTVIESCIAVGSVIFSADKGRRSIMDNHVGKTLSCSAAVDEASIANVLTLSGFSIPQLVLQIVTVDAIFRVTSPALNELVILKEIAFTVYNKARRISRGSSNDGVNSSSIAGRSHSLLMQTSSPIQGMWKNSIGSRISIPREGELEVRPGTWDNSWQTSRTGGLSCDPNRTGDFLLQDQTHYMFEPLFILADPGSLEHGVSPTVIGNLVSEPSKPSSDDCRISSGSIDTGTSSQLDGLERDSLVSGHQKTLPSLHCCYGWTEDWRWLASVWTDSRGELLDSHVFPFGGISSRQDTKGLQSLFVQMLQHGCQILQDASSPETSIAWPRDFVITRIGCFYELECQEWQKALYSIGGSEVKNWSLQFRRSSPDGMPSSSNGSSLQQQEARPSSPGPLYSSTHSKASGFMKGGLGQPSSRKQLMGGHAVVDQSRGVLQWMQSISFVSIVVDHSLQLVFQTESTSPGGSQGSATVGHTGYLEGFTPVKSLGSTSASYILIPSPSMRFLPPMPLQLPTCLTAECPPLAHLLQSKGSAIPLKTGFVVSKAVPSMRKDSRSDSKEEWPSVLSVSLVDYYGGNNNIMQEKMVRSLASKQGGKGLCSEVADFEVESQLILECVAAELHALSWMTVSPAYLERRTALPFHCDMVLRLRRLLHFADKELLQQPEKSQV